MEGIYLDYAATGPLRTECLQGMMPFWQQEAANPSSVHDAGQQAAAAILHARRQIVQALGPDLTPRSLIFTGSGTEANNMALLGTMRRYPVGSHLITSAVEHPAVLEPCEQLQAEGYPVTQLPVDAQGQVAVSSLLAALRPTTRLVSIMTANNEVGTLQPLTALGEALRREAPGVLLHTDAIQALGKVPIDTTYADLISLSAHKICGPKGVGALYLRRGVRIQPILYGGGQERGLRPSTLATPLIVGFGIAAAIAADQLAEEGERLRGLREQLWQGIAALGQVRRNGHATENLPHILHVSFDKLEGQAVLLELNRQQIYVSSASACHAGKGDPSHVLLAMGRSTDEGHQGVRFSLGSCTKAETIDRVLQQLTHALRYLRSQR